MTIQQTLTEIRALGLQASYDGANAEFRVDYRADDARHVEGKPGFGSAFYAEEASIALSAAGRMATAERGADVNAL